MRARAVVVVGLLLLRVAAAADGMPAVAMPLMPPIGMPLMPAVGFELAAEFEPARAWFDAALSHYVEPRVVGVERQPGRGLDGGVGDDDVYAAVLEHRRAIDGPAAATKTGAAV